MAKFNRKDNDGHKFNVPANLLEQYCNSKRFTEEYYNLEAQFCNEFEKYMVG